ncbi:Hypothetical predicted protein [Scomber scombrus]|uniref:Secreted protein n=1 Tax=Scomber scombrus TaxID=13677 RepID=A0AAV1PPZ6_SCOSC
MCLQTRKLFLSLSLLRAPLCVCMCSLAENLQTSANICVSDMSGSSNNEHQQQQQKRRKEVKLRVSWKEEEERESKERDVQTYPGGTVKGNGSDIVKNKQTRGPNPVAAAPRRHAMPWKIARPLPLSSRKQGASGSSSSSSGRG